jgi:hypothetical protein
VNCEKYSSTPQYCGGSSTRASNAVVPSGGNATIFESSKYCESTGMPQSGATVERGMTCRLC